jgi:hypothetical protein
MKRIIALIVLLVLAAIAMLAVANQMKKEIPKPVIQAYTNLIVLELAITHDHDTASLLALGAMLSVINDNLQNLPPHPGLQPAWNEAKLALPHIRTVLKFKLDGQSIDFNKDQIQHVINLADNFMSAEYGLSQEQLKEMRE